MVTTQLGLMELLQTLLAKLTRIKFSTYIINNKHACVLIDTRESHNYMTEATTKRLELKHSPTNSRVKTVNVNPQNS